MTQLDQVFEGPTNWNLVIDAPTDEEVSYNFQAWFDKQNAKSGCAISPTTPLTS